MDVASANDWWQYALLALILVGSIIQVLRKIAPKPAARVQAGLAASLDKPGRAQPWRRIGAWLRPAQASGDCGDGCGTCGACGPADEAAATPAVPLDKAQATGRREIPVAFHPRPKQ